jgi:hypothetical protein
MALHADTHELGPGTRFAGMGHTRRVRRGREWAYGPSTMRQAAASHCATRANAATLPITNAELGWDAVRDAKLASKRSTGKETRNTTQQN